MPTCRSYGVDNVTLLHFRNGGLGTIIGERISVCGKPHFAEPDLWPRGLTDGEYTSLAALSQYLGKQALAEVMSGYNSETLLAWHRRLIAKKFDGSQH